jgi:ubiquinone/menaquinone biosynthesis C-methylase UbiE/CelD/BcsL family acetyltransferase involved in cellulose biosynthesis
MSWTRIVERRFSHDGVADKWIDLYDVEDDHLDEHAFRLRRSFAVEVVDHEFDRSTTVLDLGCGAGPVTVALRARGFRCVGVDYSADMLTAARDRLAAEGYTGGALLRADSVALPFRDASFACVVCLGVISYLEDYRLLLREVARVMKPEGLLILSFRNRMNRVLSDPWVATSTVVRRAIGRPVVEEPWPGRSLDPGDVDDDIQAAGFHKLAHKGIGYGPFRFRGVALMDERRSVALSDQISRAVDDLGLRSIERWLTDVSIGVYRRPGPAGSSASAGGTAVEVVPVEAFAASRREEWQALAECSIESNVFLHPDFVLPSLRTAEGAHEVVVVAVSGSGGELRGVGVFEDVPPTVGVPVRHLRAYRTPYSFLSGFLMAAEHPAATASAIIGLLAGSRARWGAIEMSEWRVTRPSASYLLQAAERAGVRWLENERYERATLALEGRDSEDPVSDLGRSRRKSLRRARRRLEALGQVSWQYVEPTDADACVETFLDLEHRGWKGEEGTSLRSNPEHERFFRELMGALATWGGAFFTELFLDDGVIASTCNMRVGTEGFAFKVAYEPALRDMSPGLLNEVEFMRCGARRSGLSGVDSGAPAGAFIDALWPGREPIAMGRLVHGTRGLMAFGVPHVLRRVKRATLPRRQGDA